ncbi:MAG: dihydropteroate synthase [Rhodospirillales bacterium]|nr:dihydropteroate synthase [Rhodospirillales bacterium]
MTRLNLTVIGERINPGFKSTREFFDNEDFPALQELAKRQVAAGAKYLNLNAGNRAKDDPEFLARIIRAIQEVVEVPLSFDFPNVEVQKVCLKTYDPDKAKGQKPIVNSVAETRWEMMELLTIRPFKVILMASERLEDGEAKPNITGAEMADTAHRVAVRLVKECGLAMDDIIVDIAVSALIADTAGMNKMALDAVRRIGSDPALKGIHMSGGISNIGQQMPAKAADGSNLKEQLENAFLTVAVPLGFDYVLGTPWRDYQKLEDGNPVFETFKKILEAQGTDALRLVRKLYRP